MSTEGQTGALGPQVAYGPSYCALCPCPAIVTLTLALGTNAVAAIALCHHHACNMQLGEWCLTLGPEGHAQEVCGADLPPWAQDG